MYRFVFNLLMERNEGTADEPKIVEYFQKKGIYATDENYDERYAEAKRQAYNGEVTVEEVPAPDPVAPSQAEELAELREQLKAQQAIIKALLGEE